MGTTILETPSNLLWTTRLILFDRGLISILDARLWVPSGAVPHARSSNKKKYLDYPLYHRLTNPSLQRVDTVLYVVNEHHRVPVRGEQNRPGYLIFHPGSRATSGFRVGTPD